MHEFRVKGVFACYAHIALKSLRWSLWEANCSWKSMTESYELLKCLLFGNSELEEYYSTLLCYLAMWKRYENVTVQYSGWPINAPMLTEIRKEVFNKSYSIDQVEYLKKIVFLWSITKKSKKLLFFKWLPQLF